MAPVKEMNQPAGVIARWEETDDNFAAREREFLQAIRADLSSAMQSGDQEKIEKLLEYVNAHRLGWDQVCTAARMASLEQHEREHEQAAVRGQLAIQELMTDLEEATSADDDERVDALLEICAAHKGAWETLWEAAEAARSASQVRHGIDTGRPLVNSNSQQQISRLLGIRGANAGMQPADMSAAVGGIGINEYEDNMKMDQLQASLVQMATDLRQTQVQPAEGPLTVQHDERAVSDLMPQPGQQQRPPMGHRSEQTGARPPKSQQAKLEALRRERNEWRAESERLQGRFADVRTQLETHGPQGPLASGRTGPSPRELGQSPFQPQSEPNTNMANQQRHFDALMEQEVAFRTQGAPPDAGNGADLVSRLEELRRERNHWRGESVKLQNKHWELQSELQNESSMYDNGYRQGPARSPHSPQSWSSGRRRQA
jgi:hypothetical protein